MPHPRPSLEHRLLGYEPVALRFLVMGGFSAYAATALVIAQAWLLSIVVAEVFIEGRDIDAVSWALASILAIAALRACLAVAGEMLCHGAADRLKTRLRRDLTSHLLALGPLFNARERTGELVHTAVQGVEDLDEYIAAYQPLRWLAVLVPLTVLGAVIAIDAFTAIILLLTGPILVLFLILIGSRAREATERRFREMSWTSAHLLDMLQGLETLKLFGRSREQAAAVGSISRRHGDLTMAVLRTAFETSFVLEMCSALAVALVAVEVSLRLVEGALPFQEALALLIITPEFFTPLRQLSTRYHAGATGRAAAARIFALLDTPCVQAEATPAPRMLGLHGHIRFEHVSFAYNNSRGPALEDISFSIPRGAAIAVIGETGAGKTTLANLLLGFATPDTGSIFIRDERLTPERMASWREQVSWVPQRPHLFHGTVLDNIRLARPNATEEEVIESAMAAFAHDFIIELPRGYDTQIGENGARLSGGERQRLAIARAFLKDAPVLVVDEATSYLDADSEARIVNALGRLLEGRTALIIGHRDRLVRLTERVVVLKHGRVVETGPPDEVLRNREPRPALTAIRRGVLT